MVIQFITFVLVQIAATMNIGYPLYGKLFDFPTCSRKRGKFIT